MSTWIMCKDELPPNQKSPCDSTVYLCCLDCDGYYQYSLLSYHDGWNRHVDFDGKSTGLYEFKNVIAWQKIPAIDFENKYEDEDLD